MANMSELQKNYSIKMIVQIDKQLSEITIDNYKKMQEALEESQGFILTSPPYLPAASGREAYLFSKSIALTALGLMSVDEIESGRSKVMGSMKAPVENSQWRTAPAERTGAKRPALYTP